MARTSVPGTPVQPLLRTLQLSGTRHFRTRKVCGIFIGNWLHGSQVSKARPGAPFGWFPTQRNWSLLSSLAIASRPLGMTKGEGKLLRLATCLALLLSSAVRAESQAPNPSAPAPPGILVDVGGYRVHLYCAGKGNPTVMIVGGAFSFDWGLVQPEVARFTRVCTFDPSGTARNNYEYKKRRGDFSCESSPLDSDFRRSGSASGSQPWLSPNHSALTNSRSRVPRSSKITAAARTFSPPSFSSCLARVSLPIPEGDRLSALSSGRSLFR
jgi:hypothetical protein